MPRGVSVRIGQEVFPSKLAAKKVIKKIIRQSEFYHQEGVPNEEVIDLIHRMHYVINGGDYRVIRVRWTENPDDGYRQTLFQGYVREEATGKEKWMPVSVNKCFENVTFESELRVALRYKMNSFVIPQFYGANGTKCFIEGCGVTEHLEFHHEAPTFDEIFRQAYGMLSPSEKNWWLGFSFFDEDRFEPSIECPAVRFFVNRHRPDYNPPLIYRWICKDYHIKISASQRRRKTLEGLVE